MTADQLQVTVNRVQEDFDENVYDDDAYEYIADLKQLLAAAHSVAEGETIWWCETHEAAGRAVRCDKASKADVSCRMVEKILADPL